MAAPFLCFICKGNFVCYADQYDLGLKLPHQDIVPTERFFPDINFLQRCCSAREQ